MELNQLTGDELVALVQRVFVPGPKDHRLAILIDLPDSEVPDTEDWRALREMAAAWHTLLASRRGELGLESVDLALYRNPRANNADLPKTCMLFTGGPLPPDAETMTGEATPFARLFDTHSILIAPTRFSATAPLKIAAKRHGFRAATMPGFNAAMIPALRLDYGVIGARVERFKHMLDAATRCDITFEVSGRRHELTLDLRHRSAHASGGVFPEGGVAGNLPSGEAYIVPYEGEIPGDPSRTSGEIPVQFGDEVVVYWVAQNVAEVVLTSGPMSSVEAERLRAEPAYGNIAELGLGVLGDFGLSPSGQILLDEKLGLHIAFGRSEHFGGQVGPDQFSSPDKVVHIDRVYIPAIQPGIMVSLATLEMEDGARVVLMKDGEFQVAFDR